MDYLRRIPIRDKVDGGGSKERIFGRLLETGTIIGLRQITFEGPTKSLTNLLEDVGKRLEAGADKPELSVIMSISSAQYALELYNTEYRGAQLSREPEKIETTEGIVLSQISGAKREAERIQNKADLFLALVIIVEVEIRTGRPEAAKETFLYALNAFVLAGGEDHNAKKRVETVTETCINLVKALSQ